MVTRIDISNESLHEKIYKPEASTSKDGKLKDEVVLKEIEANTIDLKNKIDQFEAKLKTLKSDSSHANDESHMMPLVNELKENFDKKFEKLYNRVVYLEQK